MRIVFRVLCLLCVLVTVAKAEDKKPYTIDFTQVLIGIDSKPVQGPECKPGQIAGKDCPALTLGDAVGIAFATPVDADRATDFAKKFKDGELAHLVIGNKAAALTSEQVTVIKDRIGKVFLGSSVAYAAGPLLDPSLGGK